MQITNTNPPSLDTSEESKKKSAEALKALGGEEAFYGKQGKGEWMGICSSALSLSV